MKIIMNGANGELRGDLTDSGVTGSVIALWSAALQRIETGGTRNVRIDCGRVFKADQGGLRFLYVWMQCARLRGVELELVNLSDCLRLIIRSLGLKHLFHRPAGLGAAASSVSPVCRLDEVIPIGSKWN